MIADQAIYMKWLPQWEEREEKKRLPIVHSRPFLVTRVDISAPKERTMICGIEHPQDAGMLFRCARLLSESKWKKKIKTKVSSMWNDQWSSWFKTCFFCFESLLIVVAVCLHGKFWQPTGDSDVIANIKLHVLPNCCNLRKLYYGCQSCGYIKFWNSFRGLNLHSKWMYQSSWMFYECLSNVRN